MSVHTSRVYLFPTTSWSCWIVFGWTWIQTSKFTVTKRAARCLTFLQIGTFKWASSYYKTHSSLFLCSESIGQCLVFLSPLFFFCFFFSFKKCFASCTCHKSHIDFHSSCWGTHFPLDPVISCDQFSWTSVFGTKAILNLMHKNPRLTESLHIYHLYFSWCCLRWTKRFSGCLCSSWERSVVV